MAKVSWTEPALNDLGRIYDYLARQSQSLDVAERICNEPRLTSNHPFQHAVCMMTMGLEGWQGGRYGPVVDASGGEG
jgi:hypothetical protein